MKSLATFESIDTIASLILGNDNGLCTLPGIMSTKIVSKPGHQINDLIMT